MIELMYQVVLLSMKWSHVYDWQKNTSGFLQFFWWGDLFYRCLCWKSLKSCWKEILKSLHVWWKFCTDKCISLQRLMAFAKANLGIGSDVNPSKRLYIFARWPKPCHTYPENKPRVNFFIICTEKVKTIMIRIVSWKSCMAIGHNLRQQLCFHVREIKRWDNN